MYSRIKLLAQRTFIVLLDDFVFTALDVILAYLYDCNN